MGLGTSDVAEAREPSDPDSQKPGLRVTLRAGDVVVHPAGTSHENVTWDDDYEYLAFFPVRNVSFLIPPQDFTNLLMFFPPTGHTEVEDRERN